jgi:hypothetical protein
MWPISPNATQVQSNLAAVTNQLQHQMGSSGINRFPKTEKEFYAALNRVISLYKANQSSFFASKLNLPRELRNDMASISMPKVMCIKELNSGFWSKNIENKGWLINNPTLWTTHIKGLYHLIANSIWFGTFGNNVFTKALATLTTFLVSLFELSGIAILGVLKFARKALTSIPAFALFVVATITASLAWVFAKLFGANNPADWVRQKLSQLRAFFTRTPPATPSFVRRHPYLVAAGVAIATTAAAWYFRGPIATGLTSALASIGTMFSGIKGLFSKTSPSLTSTLTSDSRYIASKRFASEHLSNAADTCSLSQSPSVPSNSPGVGELMNFGAGAIQYCSTDKSKATCDVPENTCPTDPAKATCPSNLAPYSPKVTMYQKGYFERAVEVLSWPFSKVGSLFSRAPAEEVACE